METLEDKVNEFKVLLARARDLEDPWTYFFDKLTSDERFLALGQPCNQEKIDPILYMIAVQALKNKGDITPLQSFEIPQYQMLHGSSIIDEQLSIFCFVENMNMGVACFMDPKNFHTHMIRFTRMNVEGSKDIDKTFMPHLKSSLLH